MLSNITFQFALNIIFSLLIIYFCHSGWNYLKDTYSTRKTKDLVNSQIEKYKKIAAGKLEELSNVHINDDNDRTNFLTEEEKQSMNDDLTEFMNSQINTL